MAGTIISRIQIRAEGADQAAREIDKLKKAYEDTASAASEIGPGGASAGSGADPFVQATSANTNYARTTAEISNQKTQEQIAQDQVQYQEQGSRGGGMPAASSVVTQAGGVASSLDQGRSGSALGQGLSGIGSLASGPVGMGMLAVGAGAMLAQGFADNAYERLQNVYGTGMSQRLGAESKDVQNYMLSVARTGVPESTVKQLMSSASQSGAEYTPGSSNLFGLYADVATATGASSSTLGGLLGSIQRSGLSKEVPDNYNMLSSGAGAFGRGSFDNFLTELGRTIESAMHRGIDLSQESLNRQSNLLAAFADPSIGDLSPTGAVAMNQMVLSRAERSSQLSNPEDLLIFNEMRQEGDSISDVLRRMESDPVSTSAAAYQSMSRSFHGNEDNLRMAIRDYLGGSASQEQIDAFMMTEGGGRVSDIAGEGLPTAPIQGLRKDDAGNIIGHVDPARETIAANQVKSLAGFEDAMLSLLTNMSNFFTENVIQADIPLSATDVNFGGNKLSEQRTEEIIAAGGRDTYITSPEVTIDTSVVSFLGKGISPEDIPVFTPPPVDESSPPYLLLVQEVIHNLYMTYFLQAEDLLHSQKGVQGVVHQVVRQD